MIKAAQDLGFNPIDDNEADAIHLYNLTLDDVVVPKGTLCVVCEKRKAGHGYDLQFCKECWEDEA